MRRAGQAVVAVAFALVALSGLSGCGSSGRSSHFVRPSTATATHIARTSFGVFRRPARPHDMMPAVQAGAGTAPTLSRLVYAGPLGKLYAFVRDGFICFSFETSVSSGGAGGGRGGCADAGTAGRNGAAAPIPAAFDRFDRLALLLPDGVKSVTISRASGGPATVPVRGNGVVYAGMGVRGWTFTTARGVRESGVMPPPARRRAR
jgi:hypothetical protein